MYYKLYKKFYVDKIKYNEFKKVLFIRDEINFELNYSLFCLSCGNACYGIKNLCYNKKCYQFINVFSYNESGKRISLKEELEISENNDDDDKEEIELCVEIKKNANLSIINSKIDLMNLEENEFIMLCYLKNKNEMNLDIYFDEILKYLPVKHKKYSSIKKF